MRYMRKKFLLLKGRIMLLICGNTIPIGYQKQLKAYSIWLLTQKLSIKTFMKKVQNIVKMSRLHLLTYLITMQSHVKNTSNSECSKSCQKTYMLLLITGGFIPSQIRYLPICSHSCYLLLLLCICH